jgi:hypothetical protein
MDVDRQTFNTTLSSNSIRGRMGKREKTKEEQLKASRLAKMFSGLSGRKRVVSRNLSAVLKNSKPPTKRRQAKRTVGCVAAEVRVLLSVVTHACYWSVVGGSTCRALLVIFILTASSLRSRETPPRLSPLLLAFLHGGGWFSVEHNCPGAAVFGSCAVRPSSGQYVTCRAFRAQYSFCTDSRNCAAALRSKQTRQATTTIDSSR